MKTKSVFHSSVPTTKNVHIIFKHYSQTLFCLTTTKLQSKSVYSDSMITRLTLYKHPAECWPGQQLDYPSSTHGQCFCGCVCVFVEQPSMTDRSGLLLCLRLAGTTCSSTSWAKRAGTIFCTPAKRQPETRPMRAEGRRRERAGHGQRNMYVVNWDNPTHTSLPDQMHHIPQPWETLEDQRDKTTGWKNFLHHSFIQSHTLYVYEWNLITHQWPGIKELESTQYNTAVTNQIQL